jgi:hypothetical protein
MEEKLDNLRKAIPKSIRFEVFKRDSFKCQYCGSQAPDVLLEIDHIDPIAKGGDNDITNLITACKDCNAGKKDKRLDDNSAITRSRNQLSELQERRQQLEMMLDWRKGLKNLKEESTDYLCSSWEELAPGWTVSEHGRKKIKSLTQKYSIDEISDTMDIAAEQYLILKKDGTCTDESWQIAFSKIQGICKHRKLQKDNPDLAKLYHIRNIARKRCGYFDEAHAMQLLKDAYYLEIDLNKLQLIAQSVDGWEDFCEQMKNITDG